MKILGLALVLALSAGQAQAQRVHTPAAGTPERRLLMDALRLRMQRELNRPMIFEVRQLRVLGGWAFAEVVPKKPDGSAFDYRGTPMEQRRRDGVLDEASVALLRRVGGTWRVVRLAIGPTDVAWWGWEKETGAPRAVLPYP
ncbi:MAG TPA: hypothetical protein VGO40_05450 [Longimicrobium sp.]|jgi:hypothetical protein|nr:hypothetical protein [Longimicrobium sp.]